MGIGLKFSLRTLVGETCSAFITALFFIFLIFSKDLVAQGFYNAEVDSLSYEALQRKDWNKVIQIGEEAEAKGFDFYYLRLRKGVAWDNLEKYNNSEKEYKKANRFFPVDTLTHWYRYVALIKAGRESEARTLSFKLTDWQKQYSGFKDIRLNSIGVETGVLTGNAPNSVFRNPAEVLLVQRQQSKVFFASGAANMWLGNRLNLIAGYMYIQTENVVKTTLKSKPLGNSGPIRTETNSWTLSALQNSAYVGLNYQFKNSWSIFVAGTFVPYEAQTISLSGNYSSTSYALSSSRNSFSSLDYSLFIQVKKRWKSVEFDPGYSVNRVYLQSYHQANLGCVYYPNGNNRLFFAGQLSFLSKDSTRIIAGFKAGARLANWIWLEGSAVVGKLYGSSEAGGWILNNNPDQINWKTSLNFTFIINSRWEIPLRFGFLSREGITEKEELLPGGKTSIKFMEPYTYHHFIINTGIKFNF